MSNEEIITEPMFDCLVKLGEELEEQIDPEGFNIRLSRRLDYIQGWLNGQETSMKTAQGIDEPWAVEWSPSAKCFYTSPVEEMLSINRSVVLGEVMTDCLCIGIFTSREEAEQFLVKARQALERLGQ